MQFRTGVILVSAFVLFSLATIIHAGISTTTQYIIDDSTGTTTFWIGDSTGDGIRADFDTSIVYDARYWDDLTIEVKSVPIQSVTSLDSGAVTVVLQMTNDTTLPYWTPVDSIVVVDSLAAFKDLTPQKYAFARFIFHHGTKSDSSGVKAQVVTRNWGHY